MWNFNEIVRAGNSTARIKNYYPETGLIVLMDIQGSFEAGTTIIGDDSGETLTLSNFTISREYDLGFEPTYWESVLNKLVFVDSSSGDDSGEILALDDHFTGKTSQDYQTTYLIVVN